MMLPAIVLYAAGFLVLWLGIRFGSRIPALDLPETGWVKSFFWALIIFFASQVVGILLASI